MGLQTQYVVLIEPDTWIHQGIQELPTQDAGGLLDATAARTAFPTELVKWIESLGQQYVPGFKWEHGRSPMGSGSYIRTGALINAFSDEAVDNFDWDKAESLMQSDLVYSAEYATALLLAARGYTWKPWGEVVRREIEGVFPPPANAPPTTSAFEQFGNSLPCGKPPLNIEVAESQGELFEFYQGKQHRAKLEETTCKKCYSREKYLAMWGTLDCTNDWESGQILKAAVQEALPAGATNTAFAPAVSTRTNAIDPPPGQPLSAAAAAWNSAGETQRFVPPPPPRPPPTPPPPPPHETLGDGKSRPMSAANAEKCKRMPVMCKLMLERHRNANVKRGI